MSAETPEVDAEGKPLSKNAQKAAAKMAKKKAEQVRVGMRCIRFSEPLET
jgi:hypothetical protein